MGKERSSAVGDYGQDVHAIQHSKTSKRTTKPSKRRSSSKPPAKSRRDDEEESHSESESRREFDFELPCDTDWYEPLKVDLQVKGRRFWVDETKLREFGELSSKLDKAPRRPQYNRWKLLVLEEDEKDVRNMLTVLHATLYQPNDFSVETLESTLKLAAKYDHPVLLEYAAQQREKHPLSSIHRYALTCESCVPGWMDIAIDELCSRDEPITESESRILGCDAFARVAARRERIQREKLKYGMVNQMPASTDAGIAESPCPAPRPTLATEGPPTLLMPEIAPFEVDIP